jgi:EF hand
VLASAKAVFRKRLAYSISLGGATNHLDVKLTDLCALCFLRLQVLGLQRMFEELDADHDGLLSAAELQEGMRRKGLLANGGDDGETDEQSELIFTLHLEVAGEGWGREGYEACRPEGHEAHRASGPGRGGHEP